jgi:predicted dehydrogenase
MNTTIARMGRRLRLGVVGGGPGSFIGAVHRAAARLDDHYEIVAAVMSRNPDRARAAARAIGIPEQRAYVDHRELLAREGERADGIDVLAIMTPNATHYPIARDALASGLDVICDKPLATNLEDALDLVQRVKESGLVFCLTHNYTGYPMVRHARAMVQGSELGPIRQLHVEYIQGNLASPTEADRDPAANWRFVAEQCGASLVLGDIGTHAHHLASFITGLGLSEVAAELGSVVPGRQVHDYAHLLLRLEGGARGSMWVTNSAAGAEHGLHIRVFGDKGGLEWHQEEPNRLLHRPLGGFAQVLTRGRAGLSAQAERATRIVLGHPEGFHEAFANLYADAADAIAARRTGTKPDPLALDFPTVDDGARGLKFVEAAVASQRNGGCWTDATLVLR